MRIGHGSEPSILEILRGDSEMPPARVRVIDYLLPLGSVLIAAVAFLTREVPVPPLATALVALYLAVVCAVPLYRPARVLFESARHRMRVRSAVRDNISELRETARDLRRALSTDHSDTVPYLLREVTSWSDVRPADPVYDSAYVEVLREWASTVSERLKRVRGSDLVSLCNELSRLVHLYNRFCLDRLRVLDALLNANQVPEQRARYLKQQWNVRRDGQVEFVRGWAKRAKRINERTSESVCIDYFEVLGTLE